jgi:hypothetical protein
MMSIVDTPQSEYNNGNIDIDVRRCVLYIVYYLNIILLLNISRVESPHGLCI